MGFVQEEWITRLTRSSYDKVYMRMRQSYLAVYDVDLRLSYESVLLRIGSFMLAAESSGTMNSKDFLTQSIPVTHSSSLANFVKSYRFHRTSIIICSRKTESVDSFLNTSWSVLWWPICKSYWNNQKCFACSPIFLVSPIADENMQKDIPSGKLDDTQ